MPPKTPDHPALKSPYLTTRKRKNEPAAVIHFLAWDDLPDDNDLQQIGVSRLDYGVFEGLGIYAQIETRQTYIRPKGAQRRRAAILPTLILFSAREAYLVWALMKLGRVLAGKSLAGVTWRAGNENN